MALAEKYVGKEIQCLDLLIAATNKRVCKWCLGEDCDGNSCGAEVPEMAAAKELFYNDGAYEMVMLNKVDRHDNRHGHSPFTKDSYLSTHQREDSEGANHADDQEDVSIMSKPILDEAEANAIQDEVASEPEDADHLSDASDVEEDEPETLQN